MKKKEKENKEKKKQLNNWVTFSGLAFQMIIVILGGVLLGIWLDGKYENKFSVFTISCSLLGVFISLYQVYKSVKDLNDDNT